MDTSGTAPEPETTRWTESSVYDDMWVDPDDDPRETDAGSDERSLMLDYLRYYRLTLEMKCADLDAEQLARRSTPPSTMSLLGLVRHLADGERHFRRVMANEDTPWLYRTENDRDRAWSGAIADEAVAADALGQWRTEMQRSDEFVAGVESLDTRNAGVSDFGAHGDDLTLRDALVAQIAEYARHSGHADLLRERIDGRVGQ